MAYLDDLTSDILERETEVAENIPSDRLEWPGASAEQLTFMRRVYDINLQRVQASGRAFIADVPEAALAVIENGYKAKIAVAEACKSLLSTVRSDIREQGVHVSVSIASAYRSATHQFRLWQRYFTKRGGYYERTAAQRRRVAEGEHSEAAAQLLASFVRRRIGVPGFSNHNNGLAIDFLNIEHGRTIPNETTEEATTEWRRSWLWGWLSGNASRFGFFQNTHINEPWHWEYRVTTSSENLRKGEISSMLETGGGTFRRLREADVQYLALEGGGGKGFVYIGAIKALQAKRILRFSNGRLDPSGQIKGISGASAGAISAMLLSIGYDAEAIRVLMSSNNFNKFFDLPAIPSQIPQLRGCRSGENNMVIALLKRMLSGFINLVIPDMFGARERLNTAVDQRLIEFLRNRIDRSDINEGPFAKLRRYPIHYLNDIIADFGIFSGCFAREFLDRIIAQKAGQANLTFSRHYEIFRIKLILTGTNLERGTSEFFSKDTTPNMPVADAVRISMGLPFIFKPYRITASMAREMGNPRLAGLWMDGGVRNNLPIRAFENEPGANPKTLGIRLSEEEYTQINNIVDMLMALTIKQGLFGSGEADISSTSGYRQQTVILSTRGLSLTEFNPSGHVVEPLVNEAENALTRYFDQRVSIRELSVPDENVFNNNDNSSDGHETLLHASQDVNVDDNSECNCASEDDLLTEVPHAHLSGGLALRTICRLMNSHLTRWNTVKQEMVRIANHQYQHVWVNGTRTESESAMQTVIRGYWQDGPYLGTAIPAHIQIPQSAWSAAFIAWVVQQAGGGDRFSKVNDETTYRANPNGGFRPIAHWRYVAPSKSNKESNSFINPFYAYAINEKKPEVGDIVVKSRGGSGATYENHTGRLTHGDIVVQVNSNNILVIGGNSGPGSNTVYRRTVPLNSSGFIQSTGGGNNDHFAIVRIETKLYELDICRTLS